MAINIYVDQGHNPGTINAGEMCIRDRLKDMLLTKYPQGLCFHNYAENFGTTKSMILAPREGTIEICWGGQAKNCWQIYDIAEPMATTLTEMQIEIDPLP